MTYAELDRENSARQIRITEMKQRAIETDKSVDEMLDRISNSEKKDKVSLDQIGYEYRQLTKKLQMIKIMEKRAELQDRIKKLQD